MIDLRRVGVLVRDDDQDFPLTEVGDLFARHGIELVSLGEQPVPENLDLVVAMGGDGTVLRLLDLCPESPVLAINYGTVGFLTAGDRTELAQGLDRLVSGDYLISERLVLQCRHPTGQLRAVNEVMVRTSNRLVFVDVYVDDTKIRTIVADGVVVGTPTGSTGFLMSAGAPIVMPEVRCLVLDGINEYNFTSRTLILTPDSKIRLAITPETKEPSVILTADGRRIGELAPGDELHIEQAPTRARLIYFEKNYFYHNLTTKLSW